MDCYYEFKNAISHKVQESKSSAAKDISIISIPVRISQANAVIKERKEYSPTHDASSLLNFTFTECQS